MVVTLRLKGDHLRSELIGVETRQIKQNASNMLRSSQVFVNRAQIQLMTYSWFALPVSQTTKRK